MDAAILRHLQEFLQTNPVRAIAAYRAFDGEPDLSDALETLRDDGVVVALPVVHNEPGRSVIEFRQWSPASALRRNRFGIEEPMDSPLVPVTDLDLALIPLVAWSAEGGRLGMGASFYDRLFQPFAEGDRPLRIGVGYEVQQARDLALDPWDIRMHAILSENGLRRCGAS